MTWEIWRINPETDRLIDALDFGSDEGEARARFAELQADAEQNGGAVELRRDGTYVTFFSVTKPVNR